MSLILLSTWSIFSVSPSPFALDFGMTLKMDLKSILHSHTANEIKRCISGAVFSMC